jgi:hypothetical protein
MNTQREMVVMQPYTTYYRETGDRYKKSHIACKYIPAGKTNPAEKNWKTKGLGAAARRLKQSS